MDTSTPISASASASTTSIDMAAEFRAGVTAVLRTWSALRAAVEQGWGGVDSHDKAEDLRRNILENFEFDDRSRPMDRHDLEDELVAYMEEELSVVLEDDSERQVAGVICDMYRRCRAGDAGLAREMVSLAERQRSALTSSGSQGHRVVVQSPDDDDDDDDDVMDEGEEAGGGNSVTAGGNNVPALVGGGSSTCVSAKEYASGPLFAGGRPRRGAAASANPNLPPPRQLGEPEPERPAMEVDEDGFAMVQPRRSKRLANKQLPTRTC